MFCLGATSAMGTEIHWLWLVAGLLSVPALVACNGFFVAAEFALVAVRRTRVEEMVRQGVSRARAVQEAITNLDRTIAATQLGITLASLALGWMGEPALVRLVEPLWQAVLPASWVAPASHTLAVAISFTMITFMHVVFGELIPKTLALQTPDTTALWVAAPLMAFTRVTSLFIRAMNGVGNQILRWSGYEPAGTQGLVHSVEEINLLVEETQEAGLLSATQSEFVRKVFHLSGKKVRDCMVPRDRMSALELRTPPEQTLAMIRDGAHTRMPVYDGAVNNVVGIINTKDLFHLFSLHGVVILADALYPPLFLTPEADVADALQLFRTQRKFLAVVRDSNGAILGLITMEDILEEIVGRSPPAGKITGPKAEARTLGLEDHVEPGNERRI